MKKEMLFALLAVGSVANNVLSEEYSSEVFKEISEQIYAEPTEKKELQKRKEPKVFDKGSRVEIDGNELFSWLHLDGYQSNPSPDFEKTMVIKLKKNGNYDTQFQLKDIKKAYSKGRLGRSFEEDKKIRQWEKLHYYAKANNAIECPDLIQFLNKDDELKDITVVIYGTQKVRHCELYKEFLEKQKQEKDMEFMIAQIDQQQQ
jgi:hypothetical protein